MTPSSSIYVLRDPQSGDIRYVGYSYCPEKRLLSHLRDGTECHRARWIRSLLRRGLSPQLQVLQTLPEASIREAERYWIRYFREQGCCLTNGTEGGDGSRGHRWTPERHEQMRQAQVRRMADPEYRARVGSAQKRSKAARRSALFIAGDLTGEYEAGASFSELAVLYGVTDKVVRGELRARGVTCRDGRAWQRKVTDDQVAEIRRRALAGEPYERIGPDYGITGRHASRIARGLRRTG